MRIWHWQLLPYLPDRQFRGQLRELVAIMHDWRDKGRTNHLLINHVMSYRKSDLLEYYRMYGREYYNRYGKYIKESVSDEFYEFGKVDDCWTDNPVFECWHDKTYLKICMWNLYEKHMGIGNAKVTDQEWQTLLYGYKNITGEEFTL